ncbi:DUF4168 domain-containing protein [Phormidesmis priestleyi]|nr:DUF4168 domain-containing protein [Phormidesmis priestleyi]
MKRVKQPFQKPVRSLIRHLAALMVCISLCLLAPIASWASDADLSSITSPSSNLARPDTNNIPSEKVTQFVNVYLQVVALIERREGELQAAETESESLRIQRDIEMAAIVLIETAGLNRQEYLQLLSLANVDPEFGERVVTLIQETAT